MVKQYILEIVRSKLARKVISEFFSIGVPNRTLLDTRVCNVLSNRLKLKKIIEDKGFSHSQQERKHARRTQDARTHRL